MTDRLTSIEASIQRFSIDCLDFELLRNRYPELSFFFDKYEEMMEVADEANYSLKSFESLVEQKERELASLRKLFVDQFGRPAGTVVTESDKAIPPDKGRR